MNIVIISNILCFIAIIIIIITIITIIVIVIVLISDRGEPRQPAILPVVFTSVPDVPQLVDEHDSADRWRSTPPLLSLCVHW